jgi:hypothetical protein
MHGSRGALVGRLRVRLFVILVPDRNVRRLRREFIRHVLVTKHVNDAGDRSMGLRPRGDDATGFFARRFDLVFQRALRQ